MHFRTKSTNSRLLKFQLYNFVQSFSLSFFSFALSTFQNRFNETLVKLNLNRFFLHSLFDSLSSSLLYTYKHMFEIKNSSSFTKVPSKSLTPRHPPSFIPSFQQPPQSGFDLDRPRINWSPSNPPERRERRPSSDDRSAGANPSRIYRLVLPVRSPLSDRTTTPRQDRRELRKIAEKSINYTPSLSVKAREEMYSSREDGKFFVSV